MKNKILLLINVHVLYVLPKTQSKHYIAMKI